MARGRPPPSAGSPETRPNERLGSEPKTRNRSDGPVAPLASAVRPSGVRDTHPAPRQRWALARPVANESVMPCHRPASRVAVAGSTT
jgi:hypothetical protein